MSKFKIAIIGSGGAGLSACLEASRYTDGIVLITKSALGFSNTALAQGGIAASLDGNDSPKVHFEDTLRCGNYKNKPELAREMVENGLSVIKWLEGLGVDFDKDVQGRYILKKSIGSTHPRLFSCGDRTGAIIIKHLKAALRKTAVKILEHSRVTDTRRRGEDFEIYCQNKNSFVVTAQKIILCSGGSCFSQALRKGISSSNCKDATGEVARLALSLGAKRKDYYSYQYHPLGYVFPEALRGKPIPETVLSYGAVIAGKKGIINSVLDRNRKELSRMMINLAEDGAAFKTQAGFAFKLNLSPVIDKKSVNFIKKTFPRLFHNCQKHDIDITREPIFIFPTLHYQNGGILINNNTQTGVKGLYAAGEITGGIHGTGRLMGNSLLDVIYFGRKSGKIASGAK